MNARRALIDDSLNELSESISFTPRRAAITGLVEGPAEFVRPRRAMLSPVQGLASDAISTSSVRATMALPVIDIDSVRVAKSKRLNDRRRRMTVPVAAIAMASTLGLGASFLPKAVAAPATGSNHTVASADSAATPTPAAVPTATSLAAQNSATQASTVAQQQDTAQQIANAFSSLGQNTSAKLTADQAAARQAAAAQAAAALAKAAGSSSAAKAPAVSNSTVQTALNFALAQIGKPYVWGAVGPNSYDCSGLMLAAYRAAGVSLPRTTYAQEGAGQSVSLSQLQPGDLVFFYGGEHVGMYIGNGKVVHAPQPGENVKITPVSAMPFSGAVRVAA